MPASPNAAALSLVNGTEVGARAIELDPTRYGDWVKNGRCIDF